MLFSETGLAGCFVIDIEPMSDERGLFARRFCAREFAAQGLASEFVQSSISSNPTKGTLRGLHFERAPHLEDKLVSCHSGAIFDVAVDLRPVSPTYKGWVGYELTGQNHRMLYIPKGFAHGFITLAPDSVVGYQMAEFYVPGQSAGIRWDDPDVGIAWPGAPTLISDRDRQLPMVGEISHDELTQEASK